MSEGWADLLIRFGMDPVCHTAGIGAMPVENQSSALPNFFSSCFSTAFSVRILDPPLPKGTTMTKFVGLLFVLVVSVPIARAQDTTTCESHTDGDTSVTVCTSDEYKSVTT